MSTCNSLLRVRVACVALPLLLWLCPVAEAQTMLPKPVRAPGLDARPWLNASAPIELSDLRGKFVILDFWTYCCINCKHILPELKKLEHAYPNNLVVIGVHSPKFATERDAENVRDAIVRYDIEHPVVCDSRQNLWRRYQVDTWPSLRIIDPEGYVIAVHKGEITFEELDRFLKRQLISYRRRGVLDETPFHFNLERIREEPAPLRYPGKVLADEASGRLFIADSGHHRIVVTTLNGQLLHVIGKGVAGDQDGSFDEAQFRDPQGMAVDGDTLYVADTENHKIRQVDLQASRVATIAGTGKQRRDGVVRQSMRAQGAELASPWDLLLFRGQLMIAMAGSHQIWRMNLSNGTIGAYAGNCVEDIVDGALLPRVPFQLGASSFAQPSGLATDGRLLYVADSEGSSIRAVPLGNGEVQTVLGTSRLPANRLFTFGDRDGPLTRALLQHPIGVAYREGSLYVADTYNNKIREIVLAARAVRTLVGDGQPGDSDNPPRLDEPAGVSVAGSRLYIADTNNHAVRIYDVSLSRLVTLKVDGLAPPEQPLVTGPLVTPEAVLRLSPQPVRQTGGKVTLQFALQLPAECKLDPEAPMTCKVETTPNNRLFPADLAGQRLEVDRTGAAPAVLIPVQQRSGSAPLRLTLDYFYCREGQGGFCRPAAAAWQGVLNVSADGAPQLVLSAPLPPEGS